MREVALATGGALIALALGLGIPALIEHADERTAWKSEREKQGSDAYDPQASDAHYRASRDAWQRSGPAGHLLGAGLLLFALGASVSRRDADAPDAGSDRRPPSAGRARLVAASALDAALGGAILALHWLDAGESAVIRALTGAAPWLAALPFAPLVGGASVGMRLTGLRTDGGAGALVAILLWPLALLGGLHLRLARLEVTRAKR